MGTKHIHNETLSNQPGRADNSGNEANACSARVRSPGPPRRAGRGGQAGANPTRAAYACRGWAKSGRGAGARMNQGAAMREVSSRRNSLAIASQ